jgi:hypothetical protein
MVRPESQKVINGCEDHLEGTRLAAGSALLVLS